MLSSDSQIQGSQTPNSPKPNSSFPTADLQAKKEFAFQIRHALGSLGKVIILFNIKGGRLIFKSPIFGLLSVLPTSIFFYRVSLPLVSLINNWIENKRSKDYDSEVIETDSVAIDD